MLCPIKRFSGVFRKKWLNAILYSIFRHISEFTAKKAIPQRHFGWGTGTWLVVEPTPLKNDGVKVSWDDDIPNWMEKNKKCSKPPTRYCCSIHIICSSPLHQRNVVKWKAIGEWSLPPSDVSFFFIGDSLLMWVKQCHKPSPSHQHFYRWYGYH